MSQFPKGRATCRMQSGLSPALACLLVRDANCYDRSVQNRTEPRTPWQWIRYIVVAIIALLLVWMMLRMYVI